MNKYLAASVKWRPQVELRTCCGVFRPDFVASTETLGVAVECDGKEYHDFQYDTWRDAVILGEGHVNSIVRLRGKDIHFRAEDCIYVLSRWYPTLFSERAIWNLKTLALEQCKRSFDQAKDRNSILIDYVDREIDPESDEEVCEEITRDAHIHRRVIGAGRGLYEYARAHRGAPLRSIISAYDRENPTNWLKVRTDREKRWKELR